MEDEFMTIGETAKLTEWLKAKGFTAEEILECIRYIAGVQKA